jgi:hypothetical protein
MHPVLKKALVGLTMFIGFRFYFARLSQAFPQKPSTGVVTKSWFW